jgi:5,10-methylenetetrahydrofolate reductase
MDDPRNRKRKYSLSLINFVITQNLFELKQFVNYDLKLDKTQSDAGLKQSLPINVESRNLY